MSEGLFISGCVGVARVMAVSNNLRINRCNGVDTLEQAWICQNTGAIEWRPVPIVESEEPNENL